MKIIQNRVTIALSGFEFTKPNTKDSVHVFSVPIGGVHHIHYVRGNVELSECMDKQIRKQTIGCYSVRY